MIYLLGGRAYMLAGSRAKKLALLRQLALTDFCLAEAAPVARHFQVLAEGEVVEGVVSPENLALFHAELFKPILRSLRKNPPAPSPMDGASGTPSYCRMGESPLCLTTCVLVREDSTLEQLGTVEAILPGPEEKTQPGANRAALREF